MYCAYALCVTYTKLDMWQVQITLAIRRCIWPEASLAPVERAVPRHIKATAATKELSLLILTLNHVEAASPVPAPCER